MEDRQSKDLEPPKNWQEYYKRERPTGPDWETLDRRTTRKWRRSFRDAYPRPLVRNIGRLLSDISHVITIIVKFFPSR